ncbi:MAG: FAD-binding oxidoreductase [Methylobacteriaceae bacterium]|nr:FAD-binding oxidoreductase [Methylobacteriaceae bacterium]
MLVIGGGLAGCATAYFLAKNGIEVVLIERHDLNALASGSNAGSIHAQIPHAEFLELGEEWARGFAPVIPLMLESIRLWGTLESELGADLEFSLKGGLLVARTEAQMRAIERKGAIERAHGLAVEILSRADLRRIAPYLAEDLVGASFCASEGKANPLAVTPAFARAAAARGAAVLRRTALAGIRVEGQGFVAETDAGPIRAHRIINCAGAEAGRIAAMVGLDLPIEGHPIQVNVTEPAAPLVPHLVYFAGGKLTLKQTRRGAFLIGGGWPAIFAPGDARPRVDPRSIEANLRIAVSVVPALADVHLLRTWPAIVNGTADWRPVLGEVPGVPGFYMCCFPWMGFTAGPICGLAVAELILGRKPSVDITQFSALGNAT